MHLVSLLRFAVLRAVQAFLLCLVAASLVFVFVYAIGDPAEIYEQPDMTPDMVRELRRSLGLDQPLPIQFLHFLGRVAQGDWGLSYVHGRPVFDVILERFPATLELATNAFLIALGIGIPLGIAAAMRQDSGSDNIIQMLSFLLFTVPSFWVGILLIVVFSIELQVLPSSGRGDTVALFGVHWSFLTADGWRHLLLPSVNLSLTFLAIMIRMTRNGYLRQEGQDYVRFARMKGVPCGQIVRSHMLPNMFTPIITVAGLQFGSLLAYAVVTEKIFSWPGMGKLIIDSILVLDRPVIAAYVMFIVFVIVGLNFVIDVICFAIDPRLRSQGRGV